MRGFFRARGQSWAIGPLCGWRLQGLHTSVPVVFSERHGYRTFPLRIGAWRLGLNHQKGNTGMKLMFRLATSTLAAILAIALLLFATSAGAQTVPIVTYADSVKFDALKIDIARAGFKVQMQVDSTASWFDVPAASLGAPVQLPDTLADNLTYQVPISAAIPLGLHMLRLRYCALAQDGSGQVTCGGEASVRFDLRAAPNPTPVTPPGTPGNLRFGPKSGGATAGAVDAFGWLNDVPGVAGLTGKGV